jgi:hypothetical protein
MIAGPFWVGLGCLGLVWLFFGPYLHKSGDLGVAFVREYLVRILLPLSNQHGREVFELQRVSRQ